MEEQNEAPANDAEKEMKNHNKIARNLLLVLGLLVGFFALWMFISYNQTHFEYNGIDFVKVKEIAPYRTSLKISSPGTGITGAAINTFEYYFYMRNNPSDLERIPFYGSLSFKKIMVINSTESFNCDGFGIIGVANLVNLYQAMGAKVIKDENAVCGDDRYMFLQIQGGNETKIEQKEGTCYVMSINNCEILEATERFMIETFAEVERQKSK